MTPPKHAAVIGGGIAGLTTAIALHQNGWQVTVLEAADSFSEVGAGFSLTPNGVAALDTIGLADAAVAASWPIRMSGIRSANGRWLMRFDPAASYADKLQMRGMQRQRLHTLLLDAASGVELRHSARVTDVDSVDADLVVGADGINSVVRHGSPPRYSGMSSWRGIADDSSLVGDDFAMSWGPSAEFGALRTSATEVYWYGYVRMAAGTRFADEKQAALERFADWSAPIPGLIERTLPANLIRNDVYSLPKVAPRFAFGRTALVGDAAHAMLPTLGQGVNMALEDAATLGRLVGRGDNVEDALLAYDRARRSRAAGIHRNSELAATFGSHLRWGEPLRNAAIRLAPRALSAGAASSLFTWKPPLPRVE